MQRYEYKVVPAPRQSRRIRGIKTPEGRFAAVLTETINELAAEGWEYLRADSLPVEEKPGLLKPKVETYHTVLVFRRALAATAEAAEAEPARKPLSLQAEPRLGRSAAAATAATVEEPPLWADRDTSGEDDRSEADTATDDAEARQDDSADESPFAEPGDTEREISR